jgi:outer membrane protein OmpA-like peptidoglycan-associated protein
MNWKTWMIVGSTAIAAGAFAAGAVPARAGDVHPWRQDGRRPAGMTDGAGSSSVQPWHADARRPAGHMTGSSGSSTVQPWQKDSRRPDDWWLGAPASPGHVQPWRVDSRRPAAWPRHEAAPVAKAAPKDSDGDGVTDDLDKCPDTPKGATVDASGCPMDSDGDGVYDGLDMCPGTPKGTPVDAKGCPLDSDGDGVPDNLDKCPGTPPNTRVDKDGCPLTGKEAELLDTGQLRLQNVLFETNKADLKPESYPALDEVGSILAKWPELKIEIGGHTDDRGAADYNQSLSQRRAQAVLDYLTSHFSSIHGDQYTVVGYGESQPVASNDTAQGRAQNRRVEFKVLNREVLKK